MAQVRLAVERRAGIFGAVEVLVFENRFALFEKLITCLTGFAIFL